MEFKKTKSSYSTLVMRLALADAACSCRRLCLYGVAGTRTESCLTLSADGKPIVLFGLPIPSLMDANESLSHQHKKLHAALVTAGYFLIGLHATVGLLHHYINRDNTLVRKLPW